MPDSELICAAPAKLNLFLHVLGRRADGYHLLETVFRLVDFGDTLYLRLRNDGRIVRNQDLDGVPESQDLCVRAAQLLKAQSGTLLGVDLALQKRLPMGGGLGGGSSDAASVLLGLNQLWGLHWSRQRLQHLALQLGADVPVFIYGQSAFAQGIGEDLQPVILMPAWYLVLIPPVQVSTAKIFAHQQLTRDSKTIRMTDFSGADIFSLFKAGKLTAEQLASCTRNDLQAVVCADYPVVGEYLTWLNQYAPARMTGSGACVFASFADAAAAQQVLAVLPVGMRGFVARGLDRHPHVDWAN